jgi:hypothetical protein
MLQTVPLMTGKQLVQGLVCPITSASSSSCSTTPVKVTPGCQTTSTPLHALQVTQRKPHFAAVLLHAQTPVQLLCRTDSQAGPLAMQECLQDTCLRSCQRMAV